MAPARCPSLVDAAAARAQARRGAQERPASRTPRSEARRSAADIARRGRRGGAARRPTKSAQPVAGLRRACRARAYCRIPSRAGLRPPTRALPPYG